MATRKPPDSEPCEPQYATSANADDWIRQFIRHLEQEFLDASQQLPAEANVEELRLVTVRAMIATFVDSGLQIESLLEILARVTINWPSVDVTWSDALNQRRFALIDKEIQGTLTPSERVELAGLTRIMREQIDSELEMPTNGAQALHQKLLEMPPGGNSD